MAGARQNTGQEAIVNLSKKIDEMLTVVAEQYELQTQYLSSIDLVQNQVVATELKTQTQILASIEAKIASASSKPSVDTGSMKEYAKAFGSFSGAILDLIEKADEKAGEKLNAFFGKFAEGINKLMQDVDKEKAEALATVIEVIASGVIGFAFWMTLATPLLATSLLGSVLLGLNVKLLLGIIGSVDENAILALAVVLDLGWGVLAFGFLMTLYTIFAPTALIGAVLFGLTVRLLFKVIGDVGQNADKSAEAMYLAIGLGWGVLAFGVIMSLYILFAPTAMIGAVLFGLTVRMLMKITDVDSKSSIDAMNTVIGLGWGVLAFGLIMTLYILFAPTAMIGAVLFGLTVRLLIKITDLDSKQSIEAINAVNGLGWGVLKFGIMMTLYLLFAPTALIGAVIFGLTVRLLMAITDLDDKKTLKGIEGIGKLSWGVILFGIAMTLYLVLGIPALLGTILFGITIFIMMLIMKELGGRKVKKGIKGLFMLIAGIALFGIAIVLYNKFVPLEATLNVIMQLALVSLVFILIGNFGSKIKKGGKALLFAAASVAALGIAMLIWKKADVKLEDAGILAATIIGLGIIATVAGKFATDIEKGSLALTVAALPVAALSVAMMIWMKAGVKLADVGVLGATIAGLAVAMGLIGMYESGLMTGIPLTITIGSLAMTAAALPIAAISGAMMIWMAAGVKLADVGVLGAAIGMVGVEMAALGFASPLILLGSAAMTVASIPILAITGAMAVFKAAGINNETSDNLSYALESIVAGFLGGKMPGGILDSLKFAAQAAARAALLAVSSIGFLAAGVALIPITASMVIFKKADFNKTDADNLEYMLSSVVKAFGIVTDYKRQKELGFYVDPFNLMLGIMSLSGAGRVLAGLAEGVQAWAKLEVNEWEVVNPGTKDAKLVIKGRRKLNEVISAIAKPFAEVGKLEKQGLSGNPLLDAVFGGGLVSTGINALKRSGDTIISLADGVRAFATMEITEYEVVNAGTKDAKLVPKAKRKLSDTEIDAAGKNIAKIITTVAYAFAQVGRWEKNSEGVFADGYVGKGVSALAGVGDILKSMTEGVIKMAYNEIPQFDLINAGTKDAKLVPGKPLILKDTDLQKAAYNIGNILKVVGSAVADVGRWEADSKGWFSGGYVSQGVKALGGIGDTVAKISESVMKFATGKVSTMDVVGAGTKDAKLVPGKEIRISENDILKAGELVGKILGVVGQGVSNFGYWIKGKMEAIEDGKEATGIINEAVLSATETITEWAKLKDPDKTTASMSAFFVSIKDIFDPNKNKDLKQTTFHFTMFAVNLEKVAKSADDIQTVAKNMDSIQKSMKLMKDHVNGMDLKKLTLTDSMMKSIAALSKNPEAMAKVIASSISKSYEELIKALKELAAANTPKSTGGDGGDTGGNTNTGNTTDKNKGKDNKGNAADEGVKADNAAAAKAGAQKVYVVNAPAGWK